MVATKKIFKIRILKTFYWPLKSHAEERIKNWCGKLKLGLNRLKQYLNPPSHSPCTTTKQILAVAAVGLQ
jgi:hypothetical protein